MTITTSKITAMVQHETYRENPGFPDFDSKHEKKILQFNQLLLLSLYLALNVG